MIFNKLRNMLAAIVGKIRPPREKGLACKFPQYDIGRGTYGDLTVKKWKAEAGLKIGAYCSIAHGVTVFLGGEHRIDWVTTYPFNVLCESARHHNGHPASKGNVTIGNDVWIGYEALISSGVTVGDGAVIGARSVVVGEVPPYAVVAGNPAKIIKYRFDADIISRLLAIKWWQWDPERIENAMPFLLDDRIEEFLRWAEKDLQEGANGINAISIDQRPPEAIKVSSS